MRKLIYVLAAALCLTAGATLKSEPASAQTATITIGERDHWRDRDRRWSDRSDWRRWAHRSYARDCRMVTVRTKLASGRVIIRKTQRCYR